MKWAITNIYDQDSLQSETAPPAGNLVSWTDTNSYAACLTVPVTLNYGSACTAILSVTNTGASNTSIKLNPRLIPPTQGVDYTALVDFYQTYYGITLNTNLWAADSAVNGVETNNMPLELTGQTNYVTLTLTNGASAVTSFVIERASSLAVGDWTPVLAATVPRGMPVQLDDGAAPSGSAYYRVRFTR